MKRALVATVCASLLGACAWNGAPPRLAPAWKVQGVDSRRFGCATMHAEIAKSGKSGVGLVFALLGEDASCPITIDAIELRLANGVVANASSPFSTTAALAPGAAITGYVILPFDNNQAWNDGSRTAVLTIRGQAGGAPEEVRFSLEHAPTWRSER